MGIKDLGPILDSAPHRHTGIVKGDKIGHHAGDQKLPTHKSGIEHYHTQTRRDTTHPIPGELDYVHPDEVGPISQAL